ncbi:MAG: thiamine diphosphokinase [Devosia sp.]
MAPSEIIKFTGLLVIVGGGTVDDGLLQELYLRGGHLVGADGGADVIVAAGLMPEAIIGDLDSLENPMGWLGRTRMITIAEQESTDFEKSLYSTRAPVTVALGMTGKRFDHTLAALDAVARQTVNRPVILVDEADIAIALSGPFAFAVAARERVSVHPLVPIRFRESKGLKYSLDGLKMAPGEKTGTSNEATIGAFSIDPDPRGYPPTYMVVIDRRHLFAVIDALLERGGASRA